MVDSARIGTRELVQTSGQVSNFFDSNWVCVTRFSIFQYCFFVLVGVWIFEDSFV